MADFFPPVVDDTYSFGAVAAVNAMSDIYAMGGEVAVALNVCAFPGDHTVDDKEPKYGLSVMGFAHPDSIMTKADVRPGDKIVITKPPGTGIITTAGKKKAGLSAEHPLCRVNRRRAETPDVHPGDFRRSSGCGPFRADRKSTR